MKRLFLLFAPCLIARMSFATQGSAYTLVQSAVNTTLTATTTRAQKYTTLFAKDK